MAIENIKELLSELVTLNLDERSQIQAFLKSLNKYIAKIKQAGKSLEDCIEEQLQKEEITANDELTQKVVNILTKLADTKAKKNANLIALYNVLLAYCAKALNAYTSTIDDRESFEFPQETLRELEKEYGFTAPLPSDDETRYRNLRDTCREMGMQEYCLGIKSEQTILSLAMGSTEKGETQFKTDHLIMIAHQLTPNPNTAERFARRANMTGYARFIDETIGKKFIPSTTSQDSEAVALIKKELNLSNLAVVVPNFTQTHRIYRGKNGNIYHRIVTKIMIQTFYQKTEQKYLLCHTDTLIEISPTGERIISYRIIPEHDLAYRLFNIPADGVKKRAPILDGIELAEDLSPESLLRLKPRENMLEVMRMLYRFKVTDLEKYKTQKQCPEIIFQFCATLKAEFAAIIPPRPNQMMQATALLTALFNIKRYQPLLFESDLLDKLLLIADLHPVPGSEDVYCVSEFYDGVNTILNNDIESMRKKLIGFHIDDISSALKSKNIDLCVYAFTQFGIFLKDNYPGCRVDDIQKFLSDIHDHESKELPHPKIYAAMVEARLSVFMQIAEEQNPEDIQFMDALSKGLTIFGTLLKVERFQGRPEEEQEEEDIKKVKKAESFIKYRLPSKRGIREKAEETVATLQKECAQCESHLIDVISTEAKHLPSSGSQFFRTETASGSMFPQIKVGEIDVDKLSEEMTGRKTERGQKAHERASPRLRESIQSYQTVKRLHETITESPETTPIEKLQTFKEEYDKDETQNSLRSNPDPIVVRFLKRTGYILGTIFTFGALPWLMRRAPKEKLRKRVAEKLKEAERLGITTKRQKT